MDKKEKKRLKFLMGKEATIGEYGIPGLSKKEAKEKKRLKFLIKKAEGSGKWLSGLSKKEKAEAIDLNLQAGRGLI